MQLQGSVSTIATIQKVHKDRLDSQSKDIRLLNTWRDSFAGAIRFALWAAGGSGIIGVIALVYTIFGK